MFVVVPSYEFMMINEEGVVKSSNTGNILKPYTDKDGYFRIKVWCPIDKKNKGCYIHRAIAKAFIPNNDPDNLTQVNHINSNRKDNSISNLEWVSPAGNYRHGVDFGNMVVGVAGKGIKHSEEIIHSVAVLLEKGESAVEISKKLGVPSGTVNSLKRKTHRKYILDQYDIPPVKKRLSDLEVHDIINDLFNLELSNKDIEYKYSLNKGVLNHILKGNTYKHITTNLEGWDKVQRSRYKPVGSK